MLGRGIEQRGDDRMTYKPPEVNEYGSVESITEGSGTNKSGSGSDEYSSATSLTGSIFG